MEITKIEAAAEFDLFGVTEFCKIVGDKRTATDDECRAYSRWLAMKAGIVEAVTNSPALEWRTVGNKRNRFCIGAYFGDVFVPFPGADQNGVVTFELLDESGNVETSGTIYAKPNGALNVSAADAAAIKESGKAWTKANKGKAKAAPVAVAPPIAEPAPVATLPDELDAPESAPETPQDDAPATNLAETPEIPPQDEKNGLADDVEAPLDVAALLSRLDALENAVAALQSPSVGISEPAPLSGELKSKRSQAHIRAIMAYLAMRKERNAERKHNAIGMEQLDSLRADRDDWQKIAEQNAAEIDRQRALSAICDEHYRLRLDDIADLKDKRRRAILKALAMRAARNRHRDISRDRFAQFREMSADRIEAWRERDAANAELADLKRKIADPANPFRLSDMVAINDKAGEYQARAERAEAESERLRRLAVQNAGHIDTLASRIAKAETMLRDSGLMPALSIVPPSVEIAA